MPESTPPSFPPVNFHLFFQESEAGGGGGGGGELTMEEEKNDEKMALQSIYDSAFTEKIPGRGSVITTRWRCNTSTTSSFRKKFQVEAA